MRQSKRWSRGGTLLLLLSSGVGGAGLLHCGGDSFTGASDPDSGVDGGVIGPSACDPSKDPSCVNDSSGIFVNGVSGSDGAAGTKEAPVRTIGAALGKATGTKSAVYVCAGTYAEHVKVTTVVSLVGGLSCADWTYAPTNKAKVIPADAGYALELASVNGAVTVSDLEFDARDGENAGDSSVAIFGYQVTGGLTLTRVVATAGKGIAAGEAAAPPTNWFDADAGALQGNPELGGGAAGALKTCACKSYGTTTGGSGGLGGILAGDGGAGSSTPVAVQQGTRSGAGGIGGSPTAQCGTGSSGSDGSGQDAGVNATTFGAITAQGWAPSPGGNGAAGNPGGGGGGGGGASNDGAGGGGCGGCGGAGGLAGFGGGASIAMLLGQTPATLVACTLTASDAGNGGAGGTGEAGGSGGAGGSPLFASCAGGAGGNGAGGSGGTGGTGGLSVGLAYAGSTAPTVGSDTTSAFGHAGGAGDPGAGGQGGTNPLSTAPAGATGAPGFAGVAQATLEIK